MVKIILKQILKGKYWLLVLLIFGFILFSRLSFLGADLPSTHVEIEEKPGGYNAREMIFFRRWPLYSNWYQPIVYVPIQNMLSYLSFRFLGVGLAQFRLPMVLAGIFGLVFFLLILLKQTNRPLALLGLLLYAFNFEITVWNRSAISENLYLLFMPLSVYFLTRKDLRNRDIFAVVFFAALGVVAKLDGYSFYLAMILFLFFRSFATGSFSKTTKATILGSVVALAILFSLFALTNAFNYLMPMYRFYFNLYVRQESLLKGMISAFQNLIFVLLMIDPYALLAILASLPVLIINHKRLNRTDWFMIVFLLVSFITRLLIPAYQVSWKRVIFLFFPFFYVIFRALFLLWDRNKPAFNHLKIHKGILLGLLQVSISCLLFLYLCYFNKSIPRLYSFGVLSESFHFTNSSFIYLFFLILGICTFNFMLFFSEESGLRNILMCLILFLVLLSLITNSLNVVKIYLPKNIKYSYQENQMYAQMIPKEEMVVCHEQAVKAFVYLNSQNFYFNHDGWTYLDPYREILERKDLRYFILNVEEFGQGTAWGVPNKVRLELVKKAYPDLKLLGVFFASKVPLAIYDKYGNR